MAREHREETEKLLPGHVFLVQELHAMLSVVGGDDLRASFDPISLDIPANITRRDSRSATLTNAFGFAGIRGAIDVKLLRNAFQGLARKPDRSTDALPVLAEGFQVDVLAILERGKRGARHPGLLPVRILTRLETIRADKVSALEPAGSRYRL